MSKQFSKSFNPINWPAVPHDFTGDNVLGIYAKETTQRYTYGTRYITWDGRVYKYMGITTQGCKSYSGVCGTIEVQTGWVTAVAASVGERALTVTDASTIAEDQLAGGMIHIYNATIENGVNMFIVGNDASNGTNVKIYLEFPLSAAVTTSDSEEMWENPMRLVESSASRETHPWLGVPCVTAVSGQNVWVQTWGTTLVGPGNTTLDDAAANDRAVQWYGNGKLGEYNGTNMTAGAQQMAGYLQDAGTGDIAGPRIYLMCST